MLDYELFSKTMTLLCEVYNRKQTPPLMEAYYMVLKRQMSDDEFKSASTSIMSNRTYQSMPKPAEILEYVRPDLDSIATLAAVDIENAIGRHGAYSSVSFDDTVVNSVVDHLGGWIAICRMGTHDWKFAKKEVPKLYGIYARRDLHPDHLIGMAEQANGYAENVEVVAPGYAIPNVRTVPALNPPKSVDAVKRLADAKKV